jgi:hypothetical protein
MPGDTMTRWTESVSKDTDIMVPGITVRGFLARRGMKQGDLSKFIEDAVRWRVFDQTLAEARAGFSDMPADELVALIDEAVGHARATAGK